MSRVHVYDKRNMLIRAKLKIKSLTNLKNANKKNKNKTITIIIT